MRLNPHQPGRYYMFIFLNHHYLGYYKAALFEANRFNTPDYFWGPLIRTAVLSQLGNRQEVDKAMGELLARFPILDHRAVA